MYIKAHAVNPESLKDRWRTTALFLPSVRAYGYRYDRLEEVLPVTNNSPIAIATVVGLALAVVPAAWADPASDACAALADARNALYSMINARDKSTQDGLNTKVQAASTKLDSVLAGMTGADAKVAADFKTVWDQFKATREKEIIPAIYNGNAVEAKKITDGIQYERLSKMWSIMSCK